MSIEPVLEIFGKFDGEIIWDIREVIFKHFAKSSYYGLIFTMMMNFNMQSDWDYLEHIKDIFKPFNTEFYYVELIASQEVRLKRNVTERKTLKYLIKD